MKCQHLIVRNPSPKPCSEKIKFFCFHHDDGSHKCCVVCYDHSSGFDAVIGMRITGFAGVWKEIPQEEYEAFVVITK